MDRISRNLIFEVARFRPTCLFPLAATSTALNALVSGDVSYVHTLLEETFENIKCRDFTWKECRKIFRNSSLFCVVDDTNTILELDVLKGTQTEFVINDWPGAKIFCAVTKIGPRTIFLCGGLNAMDRAFTITFGIRTDDCTLTEQPNLLWPQNNHCIAYVNSLKTVYSFGRNVTLL